MKNKKKAREIAIKIGGSLKDIAVASASHPMTSCLFIMGLTTFAQIVNGNPSPNDKRRWEIRGQLGGLYNGAQGLAVTAAAVPVAVGALGVVKEAVSAYKGGTKPRISGGYP